MAEKQGHFLGRSGPFFQFVASWFVPVIMTMAYVVLALTSETDASGWAWMSIGLGFVYVLWWTFRMLTKSAAMSRAVAVGDADRVAEIDKRPLHAAVAFELRGDWARTLEAVRRAHPKKPRDQVAAAMTEISALVETGEIAKARAVLDAIQPTLAKLNERLEGASHIAARLAKGKVLACERANTEALAVLQKVIDDVRTGQRTRATAHHYAARAAAADGQHAVADKHRERATALAPSAWFA
jgi:tetratricopeptide (TPR) repeat protein